MQKSQRYVLAEAVRNNNHIKKHQQHQQWQNAATAALVGEEACAAAEKAHHNHSSRFRHSHQHHHHHSQGHNNTEHVHHQKQHSQHPQFGIAREPLRQHPNGIGGQALQQRHQISGKSAAAGANARQQGSSALESLADASAAAKLSGVAKEDEEATTTTAGANLALVPQPRPCLNRLAALPAELQDVDLNGHCTMVAAYAKDIFVYLAERELHYALPEDFLTGHSEVNERSRAILVDWLIQLSSRLELQADTYHLGIRLLDHYLAIDRSVGKRQLQLLGVAALWLASKFEEVYCISINDLLHFCSGVCNRRDLLAMELRLVKALDFHLLPPLPITFLRRLSKVAGVDNRLHYAAKYMLELATLCTRLAWRPASQLAAAAMRVALGAEGRAWSDALAFYSGYGLDDLRPVTAELARSCVCATSTTVVVAPPDSADSVGGGGSAARQHRFVYQKYRSTKCFAVAASAQFRADSEYLAELIALDAPSGIV